MKYGIVTNRFGSAWWYGCYNDFETATTIAKKVNGKIKGTTFTASKEDT